MDVQTGGLSGSTTLQIRDELEDVRQRFLRLLVPLQTPESEGGDAPTDPRSTCGSPSCPPPFGVGSAYNNR